MGSKEDKRRRFREWTAKNPEKIKAARKRRLEKLRNAFASGAMQRATFKLCPRCKTVRPASQYYISNYGPDGLHGWCKPCGDRRVTELIREKIGISPEQFAKMLATQNGCCAICGTNEPGKKGLFLDHDHASGKPRALLCKKCNSMLGMAKDDPEILRTAANYLERYK